MPKPRTKGKKGLTRGRPKAVKNSSDTEGSEQCMSQGSSNSDIYTSSAPSTQISDHGKENESVKGDQKTGDEWKKLPGLVDTLKLLPGEKFPYITEDPRFREFELNERKELLKIKDGIDTMRDSFNSALKITRSLCPDTLNGKVADVIPMLGFPKTYKDLILRLASFKLPSEKPSHESEFNQSEILFEDGDDEMVVIKTPHAGKSQPRAVTRFPSPSKMAKYCTPKTNGVFHFGMQSSSKNMLSTNKPARLPKPGEVFYSQSGSPILHRRIPDDHPSQPRERVQVVEPDGTKIEVDMVYRGVNPDQSKLRLFNELAKDFRGMAASRSTVKQNRIQPPRIKGITQSASKKPDWR